MASRPLSQLWRVKPIDLIMKQSAESEHGLKRTLTAFSITLLGIGAIVGTGIFVLTGVAAAKYAGPGLIFSFIGSFVPIVSLPLVTILRFTIWLILGLIVYFLYSRHSSHLEREIDTVSEPGDASPGRREDDTMEAG